jgi:hypothetical protein
MASKIVYRNGLIKLHGLPVDITAIFSTWSFGGIGHDWGRTIRFKGARGQVRKADLGHELVHAYDLYGKNGIQKLCYWLRNRKQMEARAYALQHAVVLGQVPGIEVADEVWTDYIN